MNLNDFSEWLQHNVCVCVCVHSSETWTLIIVSATNRCVRKRRRASCRRRTPVSIPTDEWSCRRRRSYSDAQRTSQTETHTHTHKSNESLLKTPQGFDGRRRSESCGPSAGRSSSAAPWWATSSSASAARLRRTEICSGWSWNTKKATSSTH